MKQKQNNDWKSQLMQVKTDLVSNMSEEEKKQMHHEEQKRKKREIELNKRRKKLYEFLAGYKHNSGIFINNFLRNRDYKTYCEDKFHGFDYDISGIIPNFFDDMTFSMSMVHYLGELEKNEIAYVPIDIGFVEHLIAFSEVLDLSEPLEEDLIVYRGCSSLERNGVNGIVSTTTDRKIAEQFSRGTILTLCVPKGTKCINVKSIRPKNQQRKDIENEILLPPCEYHILSEKEVLKGKEPNNCHDTTKLIEMDVTPLDLLEEFLKVVDNPPKEYLPIREVQAELYENAIQQLRDYVDQRRKKSNYAFVKTASERQNKQN